MIKDEKCVDTHKFFNSRESARLVAENLAQDMELKPLNSYVWKNKTMLIYVVPHKTSTNIPNLPKKSKSGNIFISQRADSEYDINQEKSKSGNIFISNRADSEYGTKIDLLI